MTPAGVYTSFRFDFTIDLLMGFRGIWNSDKGLRQYETGADPFKMSGLLSTALQF